jgi:hypothetical protein
MQTGLFPKHYVSYRPESEVHFHRHPEIEQLLKPWCDGGRHDNAGDLARLYSFVLNIKQVLGDGVIGNMAEVGVYKGSSAAVLAHFARQHSRFLYLFDTFTGTDKRDLIGLDEARRPGQFKETNVETVRTLVGKEPIIIEGYFPDSIPSPLRAAIFSVVSLDCDLQRPLQAGLKFFYSRLALGGIMFLHDYSSGHWAGATQAVDEFVAAIPETLVLLPDQSGSAVIRKNKEKTHERLAS